MATSIGYLEEMLDNKNIQAAIHTIRSTEGTTAEDGFYYIFGSSPHNAIRFTGNEHPNDPQTHNGITSTAAGIGQWLYKTYAELKENYDIPDFSPHSQMLLFVATFDQLNVLSLIAAGYMTRIDVMDKLARKWASLPGNSYGQPEYNIAQVIDFYHAGGGDIA